MTASEIVGFVLTLLVMIVGVAGAALPGLPGTPLIFLAALGHKLWFGDRAPHWMAIVGIGLLAALSMLLDFLATTYGARRLGATWRGMVGAGVGAILGIFIFPPFGLILLPLVGAAAAEMAGGREWKAAGKAGIGAAIGIVAGTLGKIGCSLAMIGLWVFTLLVRLFGQP
ncbi:MAG TPA: DUF456 domain-containing protein [Verrucomicrobiota bacterium]|nr:DUF456 domain-containing protein [Verrucomicrobiales bacterium]HRI13312.1 DUF456 domain-containing protein [Verrucomicrobiota bacterium]